MPTCASEVLGAFSTDEDELTSYEPHQLADPENSMGRAVVYGRRDGQGSNSARDLSEASK